MRVTATAPDRNRLAELLRDAGSPLDPDRVAELIAGVLAAPPELGTSWHVLVADPTPPALAEALEQYRAWLAEDWRDGLAPEDFARLPRPARLAMLREELASRGLDGFIVPRSDEHHGEYVPACAQRLAWLTGFTDRQDARSFCGIARRCSSMGARCCKPLRRSIPRCSRSGM